MVAGHPQIVTWSLHTIYAAGEFSFRAAVILAQLEVVLELLTIAPQLICSFALIASAPAGLPVKYYVLVTNRALSNLSNVVVIGASAGGVEALRVLVSGFSKEFPGSIFVVLHIGSNHSTLPEILCAAGPLRAMHPKHGEKIENGVIYVAPPDHHMLLAPGEILLSHSAKENHTRPAINPLFRSAAAAYGFAVTGIILSGTLDDGVLGLAEIKRKGGMAVVQDPRTALYPSMPSCAIESVGVDYILPVEDMPALLPFAVDHESKAEIAMNVEEHHTDWTCPECRGPLSEFRSGKLSDYRCRVGHAYSTLALAADHQSTVERKLWEAVLALEESAEIADRLAVQFDGTYEQQAKSRRGQASTLRNILNDVNVRLGRY